MSACSRGELTILIKKKTTLITIVHVASVISSDPVILNFAFKRFESTIIPYKHFTPIKAPYKVRIACDPIKSKKYL